MDDIRKLAAEIEQNNFMLAALHHKSARKYASEKLKEYNLDDRIIDAWESLGKSVINLYSACRAVDVSEKKPGACSLAERKIKACVYEQLGKKIRLTNKGRFGRGAATQEKNSVEVNNSLTNQLIGSIQYNFGYTRLNNEFVDKLLSLESMDIAPEKDSKTKLQEYCQRIGKKLPSYILLEETGPAHSRLFKVKVEALDVQYEGFGPSKRLAELQAAEQFIEKYSIPGQRKKKSVNAKNQIDYISVTKLMPPPINFRRINVIVEKLKLPSWSAPLVSLALTHRSYSLAKGSSILGKNNTVLAFLGAAVIEWIAFDTIIRNFSLDDLSKAGGIREVVRVLVNERSISTMYEELLTRDVLLLGYGEKNLTQATKCEFIQALFGVMFLVKGRDLECAETLISDVPIFLDHFVTIPKSMNLSRDEVVPVKSVFQEKCQLLGLKVRFQTDVLVCNQQRSATPNITIESAYLDGLLNIQGDTQFSKNNEGKPNVVLESELARKNKNIFDSVLPNETATAFELGQYHFVKWVVEHSISLASNAGGKNESLRVSKLINKNFLGVNFVKRMAFTEFERFIGLINKFVELESESNKSRLVKYFGHAGRSLDSNKNSSLSKTIADLELELSEADPLQESHDIRNTNAFKNLISEATISRLKGGDVVVTSVGEIVEKFKLLRRGEANITCQADPLAEVLEVDGAHLCLLDIFKAVDTKDGAINVEFDIAHDELCIAIKGLARREQEAVLLSPILSDLKIVLGTTRIVSSEGSLKIAIGSIATSAARKASLELWWQYYFKDPYETAANDRIASILHDVKNSILGYCFTSEYAKNKSMGRERYLLAADASGHLDKAKAALNVVKNISTETGSATVSPVKINMFIKTLISELWSWVPSSVNLIFSPCDSEVEICTDELRLRALINNLVKNSVEAMTGSGNIYISYSIEKELEGMEFVISDVGPGFKEEQLVALENGIPLKTSKKIGHGIGLMAVMLTAKELGGSIAFSNGENAGATVKVWIPSVHKN
ncbi:hypothetical protein PHLH3_59390 [Pseudomonas sp. St386]|uniref:putative dsRNA-binding protein n=1 Tax=Pseudomonas TaxID=286 RepID=UPI00071EEE6B|nr:MULTISPECIES: putative dsRNA-binding protein [Pseudomonas]ALQ00472.1 Ribonuclease III [Pseudomonas brassicacearum]BBP56313.1 hypothetical protein PHLH3_59390 [Pseudomonas sp. St386]